MGSPETATSLPVILLHRPPELDSSPIIPRLKDFYRVIDPHEESDSDPSAQTLFRSVRLLLCLARPPVTSDVLDRYPSLELVIATSAGIDHIDLAECRRRGIKVTGNAGVFSDDVADYAVGLLIDVLRRVSEADRFLRAGLWPVKGEFPLGSRVGGKRVGIVGLGSIGMRVSKRLEAFGCVVAYKSRKINPNVSYPYYADILELASWSDILILSCSSTKETYHIVDKGVMKALGKKGIIINIGRGALIDEEELVRMLSSGEIGGAGLDVFENEPEVPKQLFEMENVVLSPHRAVLTPESFAELQKVIMHNLEAFFSNKPLMGELDIE
ncbi:OLC1v1031966C1 [Oldenlandia corymbosa var. corymbosa]|uniref:OLC1v1031966C1 n=1 Tax=Oldenlandia corymbosa var. corymbosa TaxID=529605 RepID=A0AAV1CLD2_OLDCO|nr:OLC1v1031966C1 [Oldenlandia corymbosa var. corymbosa]